MKINDQQRLESLEEKKAAHMQTGFGNFIAKGDRLANSRDANPLETIWIITDEKTYKEPDPQITGRAKAVTTLRLSNTLESEDEDSTPQKKKKRYVTSVIPESDDEQVEETPKKKSQER